MNKKNQSPIKWMFGILIALMAAVYLMNQVSSNMTMHPESAASFISSPYNFFQFLANMAGLGNHNSSTYNENNPSNQNTAGYGQNGSFGMIRQNPNLTTAATQKNNLNTGQGANAAQQGNGAGNNPGANAGSNEGSGPGSNPGTNPGQGPGNLSGSGSGGNSGTSTNNNPGNNPGDNSGNNPGDNSGNSSGDNSGGNSGDNSGSISGGFLGSSSGSSAGSSSGGFSGSSSGSSSGGFSGSSSGSSSGGFSGSSSGSYSECIPGCYPGCLPGCDPECTAGCLLAIKSGNNTPPPTQSNTATINPIPTNSEVSQSIAQQNQEAEALATILASRQALVVPVQQQAQASKYQTVSYQNIPVPSTNPVPADIEAKVQSKQYSFH